MLPPHSLACILGSNKKETMIATIRNLAFVVACVSLIVGCASTKMGNDFNSENVSKLKVGVTTEQEVVQLIGQPSQRTRSSDGSVHLMYMYSPGQTVHAFTPIRGLKSNGTKTYVSDYVKAHFSKS